MGQAAAREVSIGSSGCRWKTADRNAVIASSRLATIFAELLLEPVLTDLGHERRCRQTRMEQQPNDLCPQLIDYFLANFLYPDIQLALHRIVEMGNGFNARNARPPTGSTQLDRAHVVRGPGSDQGCLQGIVTVRDPFPVPRPVPPNEKPHRELKRRLSAEVGAERRDGTVTIWPIPAGSHSAKSTSISGKIFDGHPARTVPVRVTNVPDAERRTFVTSWTSAGFVRSVRQPGPGIRDTRSRASRGWQCPAVRQWNSSSSMQRLGRAGTVRQRPRRSP